MVKGKKGTKTKKAKAKKAKARTVRVRAGIINIPSNGLETQKEGWVEMHAYIKTTHLPYFQGLDLKVLGSALDQEVSPFDDEYDASVERKEKAMRIIHRLLSVFVLDWSWVYPDGAPYPEPKKNIEAFELVKPEEFEWLFDQLGKVVTEEPIVIPKQKDTP